MQEQKGTRVGEDARLQDVRDRGDRGIDVPDAHDIEVDRLKLRVHVDHTENLPVILAHFSPHYIESRRRGREGLL